MTAFRCGYVAIVGWPNVGKSSLMNALLGFKLAIVSAKPQTTRDSTLGILNEPNLQMIFVDTPGWLKPKDPYQGHMKKSIMRALHDDADVVVWMIEPRLPKDEEWAFGRTMVETRKPLLVAVNKFDEVPDKAKQEAILADIASATKRELGRSVPVFGLSAKTKAGLTDLKKAVAAELPAGPPFFPQDQVTDRWERFYVGEIIRETIMERYRQEIPHAAAVIVDEFIERPGAKDRIRAIIYMESDAQKKIMVGGGGQAIKELGQSARKRIEAFLGRETYLELVVKVRKHWRSDPLFLKDLYEKSPGMSLG